MSSAEHPDPRPTLSEAISFSLRSSVLKIRRIITEVTDGPSRYPASSLLVNSPIIAESRTALQSSNRENVELVLGKIENLRIASRQVAGIVVPAGSTFSFWKHVGRPSKAKGYVIGREVREGCIIPTIGGGLCQLSNALYDAALKANFEIIERHAHSRVIQGSLAESGRDATVFWNYVDLRFRAPFDFRIEIELTPHDLVVQFRGVKVERIGYYTLPSLSLQTLDHDCMNCGVRACFRHTEPSISTGREAYLLDSYWPEYDRFLQSRSNGRNVWYVPIHAAGVLRKTILGDRSLRSFYEGETMVEAPFIAIRRRWALRHLPPQGGALQKAVLQFDGELAEAYARKIPFDAHHLTIAQNLLIPLHKLGVLGGRTYDVLMTRLPLTDLQSALDRAKQLHPESSTLGDFRIPSEIASLERSLLDRSNTIITPHAAIASRFPHNSLLLEWDYPAEDRQYQVDTSRNLIVFPYPAIGRKGAYEMRDTARILGLTIGVLDRDLESPNFWKDCDVIRLPHRELLPRARAIISPSFVENEPRVLLKAIAKKIPVIVTRECGITPNPLVRIIESGNVEQLVESLTRIHED